jgi:hypothetical protein
MTFIGATLLYRYSVYACSQNNRGFGTDASTRFPCSILLVVILVNCQTSILYDAYQELMLCNCITGTHILFHFVFENVQMKSGQGKNKFKFFPTSLPSNHFPFVVFPTSTNCDLNCGSCCIYRLSLLGYQLFFWGGGIDRGEVCSVNRALGNAFDLNPPRLCLFFP